MQGTTETTSAATSDATTEIESEAPGFTRPSIRVAVVMERESNPNQWEAWRFKLIDVVPHEDVFGTQPRVLRDDGKLQRTLYPNFTLHHHRDPDRRAGESRSFRFDFGGGFGRISHPCKCRLAGK